MLDTSLPSSDRDDPPSMPCSEASAWVAAKRAEIGVQFDDLHHRLGFTEDIALHPLCKVSTR